MPEVILNEKIKIKIQNLKQALDNFHFSEEFLKEFAVYRSKRTESYAFLLYNYTCKKYEDTLTELLKFLSKNEKGNQNNIIIGQVLKVYKSGEYAINLAKIIKMLDSKILSYEDLV